MIYKFNMPDVGCVLRQVKMRQTKLCNKTTIIIAKTLAQEELYTVRICFIVVNISVYLSLPEPKMMLKIR